MSAPLPGTNEPRVLLGSVRILDMPQFKAAMLEVSELIETLTRERDEWEQRYEDLLASIGGTAP